MQPTRFIIPYNIVKTVCKTCLPFEFISCKYIPVNITIIFYCLSLSGFCRAVLYSITLYLDYSKSLLR